MALSRRLGVVAILGSCWFTAVACGDDDDSKRPSGSEAGAGGEGGDADGNGAAGSKNTAGKGGTAAAGSGGKPSGGSAGAGGLASGDGGSAGSVEPGVGGAGGSDAEGGAGPLVTLGGQGGAGASSAGGEGGAPLVVTELKSCSDRCVNDNDCKIGADNSYRCNVETNRCENPFDACEADDDCVSHGWFFDCDENVPCFSEDDVCISWQGRGWCASKPDQVLGCITGGEPEMLPVLGSNDEAEVCVDRAWICGDKKTCEVGCSGGFGCGGGKGDICNEATHRCECGAGTECTSGVCGDDDQCAECVTDAHCTPTASISGNDVCVDGKCGCSGPDKCYDYGFAAATTVCE
jgi:hypothetical protein